MAALPQPIDEYNRRQETLDRLHREELYPECLNCGGHGKPIYFDFGRCAETGYDDAGQGCTECLL